MLVTSLFYTLWSDLLLSPPFVPHIEHQKGLSQFNSIQQLGTMQLLIHHPHLLLGWGGGWEKKGKTHGLK